jgi:hypothetical protein
MLNDSNFQDVAIMNVKITDANLSDREIERAQIGGAFRTKINPGIKVRFIPGQM